MNDAELNAGIAEIIGQNFPKHKKPITDATRFPEVTGWDSVGHIAMMLDVEDKFGVAIPEDEVFDVADVATLKKRIRGA